MSSRTPPLPRAATGRPEQWDDLWRDAAVPDQDRDAWRAVLAYRTKRPDDAVALAQHGWTPGDVMAARTNPDIYWDRDPAFNHRTATMGDEERVAALAVLTDETARWHENRARLALEVRADYIHALANELPEGHRWSMERIGTLLGLTRQRVRMILKRKAV